MHFATFAAIIYKTLKRFCFDGLRMRRASCQYHVISTRSINARMLSFASAR
jgi:hypothetical protein